MLRRDLNQQGGSDGGKKNMYCTLYNYYSEHKIKKDNLGEVCSMRPLLWSSGQSFWLQIQRSRVRFPALPDFLSSSGSGTGSTQPREVN